MVGKQPEERLKMEEREVRMVPRAEGHGRDGVRLGGEGLPQTGGREEGRRPLMG